MEQFLIEKVRLHEIIWNTNLSNYREQSMRKEAWNEIGREMNMTPEDVKGNWDKLRRCYLNALNRRRAKINGDPTAKPTPPWRYEKQMEFLLPFIESRKTHCTFIDNDTLTYDSKIKTEMDLTKEGITYTSQEESDFDFNGTNLNRNTPEKNGEISNDGQGLAEAELNPPEENSISKKRKSEENFFNSDLDETEIFFMNMAKMTKKLPLIDQAKIKKHLSNAVLDAQIKILENQEYWQPTSSNSQNQNFT